VGDVQRPGAYDVSSLSTPLNALYAAGGPTGRGSLRTLKHYRGNQLLRTIDLYDFLLHGVRSDIDRLLPGDTLLVPLVGPQVAIAGAVRRPAIYELKSEQSLKEALELAGGTVVSASLKQIKVERIEAHQRRTMLSLDMPSDTGSNEQIAAFRIQDGDSVLVSAILPYNEQMVYLDGHVFRPGSYPYHEGMTLNELLGSYRDVMPEPAEHAEIVRLLAPDYRPQTLSIQLSEVLAGNSPMLLRPFDLVRVFGRYELDAPKVVIRGEVQRPGEYPLSQGMTVAGLVETAGGFKRSAYRAEADLSSYVLENGEKILLKQTTVQIGEAVAGDRKADVRLKPGDLLGIRQLSGWQDIGSSVVLAGEVKYPGTYGIDEGERLSSVLKRAGGLRETAYAAGAVLERKLVGELAEKTRQETIRRLEATVPTLKSGLAGGQDQLNLLQSMQQQQQQALAALRAHPASSRQVVKISNDIARWEGTAADIELRAGDTLVLPKRPNFVIVSGQVYNSSAITFIPGRTAGWYLGQAGGATQSGNKRATFIVRADGSVLGYRGLLSESVLSIRMQPGDAVVVPEKIAGGSQFWRTLIGTAQIMSSVALTGAAAGLF